MYSSNWSIKKGDNGVWSVEWADNANPPLYDTMTGSLCTCSCHRDSEIKHITACCEPLVIEKDKTMPLLHGDPAGEIFIPHTDAPQPSTPVAPEFTVVQEQSRTYVFPHGKVTLTGVVSINVSKSGTHRVNTVDGKKHIIPTGWLHIEFIAPSWTF